MPRWPKSRRRDNRDQVLQVRLTEAELEELQRAAERDALDTSSFVRTVAIQYVRVRAQKARK